MLNVVILDQDYDSFGVPFKDRWVVDVSAKEVQDQYEGWEPRARALVKVRLLIFGRTGADDANIVCRKSISMGAPYFESSTVLCSRSCAKAPSPANAWVIARPAIAAETVIFLAGIS